MRSALYRCPGLLQQIRLARLGSVAPLARSWSSQPSGQVDVSGARFPLYRPPPDSESPYSQESYGRHRRDVEPTLRSLPSDRKIRKSAKIQLTDKALEDMPELQEDELRQFYAAVMESGKELLGEVPMLEAPNMGLTREEKWRVVEGLAGRLLSPSDQAGPSTLPTTFSKTYDTVAKVIDKLRSLSQDISPSAVGSARSHVSLGLVSRREWEVLLDQVVRQGAADEAEGLLELMNSHGVPPVESQVVRVMQRYSREGRITDVARLHDDMKLAGMRVGDAESDLLIEAHLAHSPPLIYPAVDLLSGLAAAGTPMPQSSYNILLNHLTSKDPTSQTHALAWDLFANMRLTAHPNPSQEVYSTMIKACAAPRDPQPERARDYWIEMTDSGVNAIIPERTEYNAIIRALSSTKKTYLEAFDLLRQMLAKHAEATFIPFDESNQDIERWSRYVPTNETFCALLEGTKRAGDLNRARWVVNEVVRLQASGLGQGWKGADEEMLSGVFMTYASWKPTVRRAGVKETSTLSIKQTGKGLPDAVSETQPPEAELDAPLRAVEVDLADSTASSSEQTAVETSRDPTHAAPQTSADALREADALFDQILRDSGNDQAHGPFTEVRLSTRLINSYLSVHLAHSPTIVKAREVWDTTWATCDGLDAKSDGWSMMQILERCSTGDLGEHRPFALSWAQKAWSYYITFANESGVDLTSLSALPDLTADPVEKKRLYLQGLGSRQLERSFRSYIRLLALSPSTPISESLSALTRFHTLFPPSAVLQTYTPTPETPFKIRMTDPTAVPESDIPPVILWKDLDVVHQRLAREGRKQDIGWLTWVCKSYELALRKRRSWRLRNKGPGGRLNLTTLRSKPQEEFVDEDDYRDEDVRDTV